MNAPIPDQVNKCINTIWNNPSRQLSTRQTRNFLPLNDASREDWFGLKHGIHVAREIASFLHQLDESQLTQQNFNKDDVYIKRKDEVNVSPQINKMKKKRNFIPRIFLCWNRFHHGGP